MENSGLVWVGPFGLVWVVSVLAVFGMEVWAFGVWFIDLFGATGYSVATTSMGRLMRWIIGWEDYYEVLLL